MIRKPLKIEELLERLGTSVEGQSPQEPMHRYELRRRLLCSRYFGENLQRQDRWNRMVSFTAPLFAGGVLVIIFSIVGSSMSDLPLMPHDQEQTIIATQISEVENSTPNSYVDFRPAVPLYDIVEFVHVKNAEYILMQ